MLKKVKKEDDAYRKKQFSKLLLSWNATQNNRKMPWKGEKDPYKIWVSEIILQQTRVDQGLAYFNRFIERFPTIHQLANASDNKIFKLWEGLGYYSRCKNLITTARYISKNLKGRFPDSYEKINELAGIGPYTAAAISSFAFNLPYAVVDGNVFRVLARIFGLSQPTDSGKGKKYFSLLANEVLDKREPGNYNQAIMDFGAIICKPLSPLCERCVFNKICFAFLYKRIDELPVKKKKINIRKRWFYYLVIENENKTTVRQRKDNDIWQQLYEFPLVETKKEETLNKILKNAQKSGWITEKNYEVISVSALYKQHLSHQLIVGKFIGIKLKTKGLPIEKSIWVTKNGMKKLAFPKFINQYLDEINQQ